MYAIEQIKEYIKIEGRMVLNNSKKDIDTLSRNVLDDEVIEGAAIFIRGFGGLKPYLGILTSKRRYTDIQTIVNIR